MKAKEKEKLCIGESMFALLDHQSFNRNSTPHCNLPSPFHPVGTTFCTLGPFWADFKSKLLSFEIFNVNYSFFWASGVFSAISKVITYF